MKDPYVFKYYNLIVKVPEWIGKDQAKFLQTKILEPLDTDYRFRATNSVVNHKTPWKEVFAWYPVKTKRGVRVWSKKVMKRKNALGHTEYASIFDVLAD